MVKGDKLLVEFKKLVGIRPWKELEEERKAELGLSIETNGAEYT